MSDPVLRPAAAADLDPLLEIERLCFVSDRLSRRSFRRWLSVGRNPLLVLEAEGRIQGYGVVLLRRGSRLARLYSLALHPRAQGRGWAGLLMQALESAAAAAGCSGMRLEVARHNSAAIRLYQRLGYTVFAERPDYYEDHSDALRMHKPFTPRGGGG